MNFDSLGFTLSDGIVVSACSVLPLLITPMWVDGRTVWRVIWDAVKRIYSWLMEVAN